jgi:aminoglycoside 6'-N-acetyltransferase I
MIKQAVIEDSKIIVDLALLLWPDNTVNDLEEEIKQFIMSNLGVIFIYFNDMIPVGFVQCNLRNDYVEGTNSCPVGYLEGIYVKEEYRKSGIGKKLLIKCEDWAKSKGCSEFASDCELYNSESLKFHLQIGFEEANRVICFKKKI